MPIKLGNTDINKLYLGSTEIQKVYLGSNLILDNTVPPFDSGFIINGTADNSDNMGLIDSGDWEISSGLFRFLDASTGRITWTLSQELQAGNYNFGFDALNAAGNIRFQVIVRNSQTFTSETVADWSDYTNGTNQTLNISPTISFDEIRIEASATSGDAFDLDNVSLFSNSDFIINGSFDDDSNIIYENNPGSWTIGSGVASYGDSAVEWIELELSPNLVGGTDYILTLNIANATTARLNINLFDDTRNSQQVLTGGGFSDFSSFPITINFTASGNDKKWLRIEASTGGTSFDINSASILEQ